MSTRILVLGATGQLGRDVVAAASARTDVQVTTWTRTDLDLYDLDGIEARLRSVEYDVLLNCVAFNRTVEAELDPRAAFVVNAQAVSRMARACREHDARLVHVSSDYVFDGNSRRP